MMSRFSPDCRHHGSPGRCLLYSAYTRTTMCMHCIQCVHIQCIHTVCTRYVHTVCVHNVCTAHCMYVHTLYSNLYTNRDVAVLAGHETGNAGGCQGAREHHCGAGAVLRGHHQVTELMLVSNQLTRVSRMHVLQTTSPMRVTLRSYEVTTLGRHYQWMFDPWSLRSIDAMINEIFDP